MIRSVVILGAGNVASHLIKALLTNTINVRQVYNRTLEEAKKLGEDNNIHYTDKISELEKADLYIIATSDSSIEEISFHIPFEDTLVVHTSGSVPMDALKGKYRKGVFYPMQSFSKDKNINYSKVPFFIEAQTSADENDLLELGKRISNKAYVVDSQKRLKMHISAVFVNNFVNHLYTLASNLTEENDIPFDVFFPLIQETTDKILSISPLEAQTGPARRGDSTVVEKHLEMLEEGYTKQIYSLISKSINDMYNEL